MKSQEPHDKIKLCMSACLLGNNVRYDGGNKFDQILLDAFGPAVEWIAICPEVEAGFPVPREPMQLAGDAAHPRLVTRDTKLDRTEALESWIVKKLISLEAERIGGVVLKARSPSCGVRDAELVAADGTTVGRRPGLFAEAVMRRFPSLPIEDEESLRDASKRRAFLARLMASAARPD